MDWDQVLEEPEEAGGGPVLPEGCPVTPVGKRPDGGHLYFNARGELRELEPRHFTVAGVLDLFGGDVGYLASAWESQKASEAWDNLKATSALMRASYQLGLIEPEEATRGPGVWPWHEYTKEGQRELVGAVVHCGDILGRVRFGRGLVDWEKSGRRVGGFLYRIRPPEPRPAMQPAGPEAATAVLRHLASWNWRDRDVAPQLVLGEVGLGMVPAMLVRRPFFYLVGKSGAGKSDCQQFVAQLIGRQVRSLRDPTADSIRRREVQDGARFLVIDDWTAKEDNRRQLEVIQLAKNSFEPGQTSWSRGGSQGGSGRCEAAFFFSSVNPPPLAPEEANRCVRLELLDLQLGEGQEAVERVRAHEAATQEIAKLGPGLYARLLARLEDLAPAFSVYKAALVASGHAPRWADTYAAPLACADLLLFEDLVTPERAAMYAERLPVAVVRDAEDAQEDWEQCLRRLLTSPVKLYGDGAKDNHTMAHWIANAAQGAQEDGRKLMAWGVKVIPAYAQTGPSVAISNNHRRLEDIFRGSDYAGGWRHVLLQAPGAIKSAHPLSFGKQEPRQRAVVLPLDALQLDGLVEEPVSAEAPGGAQEPPF